MAASERIASVVAAVVATLLQVFLAPHVAIAAAFPNFMVVACMVSAMLRPQGFGCVLPFVVGLLFDLMSGGPVGAMAFSLTAFSVGSAWFYERVNNDTSFMAFVVMAVGLLLVEVCYGLFFLLFGYDANVFEAFAYHTLPCYLYDLALAAVAYLIFSRFRSGGEALRAEITQLQ